MLLLYLYTFNILFILHFYMQMFVYVHKKGKLIDTTSIKSETSKDVIN